MQLGPGSYYVLDHIQHQIPPTEQFSGPRPKWTPQKAEFLTELKRILAYFHTQAEKYQITYYLCCGTLLGAVKWEGFLPWDTDADVSVLRSEVSKVEAAFRDGPFRLIPFRYGYKLTTPRFPYYPFLDIMIVDLDPRYPTPTYAFAYPLDRKGNPTFELRHFFNKKKHAAELIFPLRQYSFEGLQLWGPARGEEVCVQNYGASCLTSSFRKWFDKHWLTALIRM